SHPDALEKFAHFRALVTLAERSAARTGAFDIHHLPESLLYRLRQDAPLRPGVLGVATLQHQLQGSTYHVLQKLIGARQLRSTPTRWTWSAPPTHLHFVDTHTWTLEDGTYGADLLIGRPYWDNLLEPWAKLCIETAHRDAPAHRI